MVAQRRDGPGTDEALVAAYVAGDAAAFDELVRRYTRRVYGICWRYFHDAAEAEDAVQETFVVLLRRASTYRGGAAFSTWLYRVATNACHDIARRKARRPVPSEPLAEEVPATDNALEQRELGADLTQALAQLERDQREAIVLHDVIGLPYADVAVRQNVAVGTVKSRIARGHARLADLLEAADRSPPHAPEFRRPRAVTEPSAPPTPPTVTP